MTTQVHPMTTSVFQDNAQKIAVVGIAARYPGAKNVAQFWENLRNGKETVSFFSDQELLDAGVDPGLLGLPNYVKAGGVYEGSFLFDARFFGYTPREAELMDPQQRIFLECCWEALENSGYDPHRFPGRIGLFGGSGTTQYLFRLLANPTIVRSISALSFITANDKDYLATRVGYKLNLRGPCVTVQTACSTSLVSVVLACQSLLTYQSDIAMAGGVRTDYQEKRGYLYEEGSINSADGHCRTFDAKAKGTIWGAGSGVVVLKRLEDALADGDNIRAVVLGYGLNNDGMAKVGFTAPGVEGQVMVTSEALAMAGVDPESLSYVECHGTATPIGDPIEIAALSRAFRTYTSKRHFCAVGSVKTNIGHTDAAAGAAGFIKAVLSLEHAEMPASLNYDTPNPQIEFDNSPFYVNTKLTAWPRGATPRRAGVNSFGIGGTNAHVILEEAPPLAPTGRSRPSQLIVISAKTPTALDRVGVNLAAHFRDNPTVELADAAFTLQVGRSILPYRRFVVCNDLQDALAALESPDSARLVTAVKDTVGTPVAWMFPGQGTQYPNMGRELYECEPTFRAQVEECAELLKPSLGLDLRDLLFPETGGEDEAANKLGQTAYTQPALFVVEYALAKLWMEWGVRPDGMIGHSVGEYVAACVAGVLSLSDALMLIAERGRLMQQLPGGSMTAVLLPEAEVHDRLVGFSELCVAAVNGPSACVVSGPTPRIEHFEQELERNDLAFRRLRTSHAFHSSMMDPILDAFGALVAKVNLSAPVLPYISNVTGTWITPEQATDPDYWVTHLRAPVRFSAGATELMRESARVMLEVGPGRALGALIGIYPGRDVVSSLPQPSAERLPADAFLLTALGRLWAAGVAIEFAGFYKHERRRRIELPTYPFEREEYKLPNLDAAVAGVEARHTGRKQPLSDWFHFPSWKRTAPVLPTVPEAAARWLVFLDPCGLGLRIVERLRTDQEVVCVLLGEEFKRQDAQLFSVRPSVREDYASLLNQLRSENKIPSRIVHLWAVTPEEPAQDEMQTAEEMLGRTFYSLLHLTTEFIEQFPDSPAKFHIVSNAMHDVVGEQVFNPLRATLMGPAKSIPREHREFESQCLDVRLPRDAASTEILIGQVTAELFGSTPDEVIAFRGGHRWLQTFEMRSVPEAPAAAARLRRGGVYLITGAMGGIGHTLADYLARTMNARLVLVGRSAFPARSHWKQWLETHASGNKTSRKIRRYLELEVAGAEIMTCTADVSDLTQMRRVVQEARHRFGCINGVIHAAGLPGQGIMELKTAAAAADVLAPKVMGTLVLSNLTQGESLDFFVLCSSMAGFIGSEGQSDYAAGNCFMDAFAQSRKDSGPAAPIAIDWDRWDEVGMAITTTSQEEARDQQIEVGREWEPIAHPIIKGRFTEGLRSTYVAVLAASSHWIVGEHKLLGSPTLVGTAYLELARAAYSHQAKVQAVELHDVVFLGPLVMEADADRELHVVLTPDAAGQGRFDFRIKSRSRDSDWQDHAMGRIGSWESATAKRHVLPELPAHGSTAEFSESAEADVLFEQMSLVEFSERWNGLVALSVGTEQAIATLHLPNQFAEDLEQFVLHPALLDTAISFPVQFASRGASYLPFSYNRVRITKALPAVIRSFARFKPASSAADEFLSFDVVLLDENNEELVAIDGYGLKRVSDGLVATVRQRAGSSNPAQQQGSALRQGFDKAGERILSAEGVEVFLRTLSLLPCPQVGIATKGIDFLIESAKPNVGENEEGESGQLVALSNSHPRPNLVTPYLAPRSDLEDTIATVWQTVLGIEKVGVNDNFVELGGHSLLAVQVAARIRDLFEISFSVASLYKNPTVAGLGDAVVQTILESADAESVALALEELN
jgi:phthiocerol/phenolphthiocerol synthesis type-I polyketide synthase E